jgi:hypothetical protein
VGTRRTASDLRRAARLTLGANERPTLLPCPVCAGAGIVDTITQSATRYGSKKCRWCVGSGVVDAIVMGLWVRWLRLRNANRRRCQKIPARPV